jgi:hypothetical protein
MVAKGEANSYLLVVPPENRVSGQYIVLEASSGPSDLNPWIQGLLGTSRTFMVSTIKAHKSHKSWLGRIYPIWKEFESITSPTFGISIYLCTLQKLGYIQRIRHHFLTNFISISIRKNIPTTFMFNTFLFDIVFRSEMGNLCCRERFLKTPNFTKLRGTFHICANSYTTKCKKRIFALLQLLIG